MTRTPFRILLASSSPRRRLLLPLLGFEVEYCAANADERPRVGEQPRDLVARLAEAKARACWQGGGKDVVLGADTTVVLDGQILGKPESDAEALDMLQQLRGREHEVYTATALLTAGDQQLAVTRTAVRMRSYADDEARVYVRSGRPLDKAGAYAIQDEDFGPVAQLDGCFLNVVGLPLCEVSRGLQSLGLLTRTEAFVPPCRLCQLGRAALTAHDENRETPGTTDGAAPDQRAD